MADNSLKCLCVPNYSAFESPRSDIKRICQSCENSSPEVSYQSLNIFVETKSSQESYYPTNIAVLPPKAPSEESFSNIDQFGSSHSSTRLNLLLKFDESLMTHQCGSILKLADSTTSVISTQRFKLPGQSTPMTTSNSHMKAEEEEEDYESTIKYQSALISDITNSKENPPGPIADSDAMPETTVVNKPSQRVCISLAAENEFIKYMHPYGQMTPDVKRWFEGDNEDWQMPNGDKDLNEKQCQEYLVMSAFSPNASSSYTIKIIPLN